MAEVDSLLAQGLSGHAIARNPYKGGVRPLLRELGRLLQEQRQALNRIK